jgi:hypothetical protein
MIKHIILADFPDRHGVEARSGRNIARADIASSISAEPDPRIELGVVAGLPFERQHPLAMVPELKALRVEGVRALLEVI